MINISEDVRRLYPGIQFGSLVVKGLGKSTNKEAFTELKKEEISELIINYKDYERNKFINTEPMMQYRNYYKKYNKTYHLLLQLESVVLKGRSVPDAGAFVEAMFLAELKDLILTAGHDMDALSTPLNLKIAKGGESFTGISGQVQALSENDLYLEDQLGILSSIINGPDDRTRISSKTKRVMYFAYGVQNITRQQIMQHLNRIKDYLAIYAPDASFEDIMIWE